MWEMFTHACYTTTLQRLSKHNLSRKASNTDFSGMPITFTQMHTLSELRRHVRVVYVRRYSLLANGLDLIRFSIEIPPSYVAMKTPSVLDGGY
jgi:phosphatidylserine synthase